MKLFDIIRESSLEIDEQAAMKRLFQGLTSGLKNLTLKNLKAVHPVFAKDLQKVFAARTISGVSKIDDLVVGISKGTLSNKAYGDLVTGLLKTKGVSDDYIRMIAKDWVEDSRFIANYAKRGDKLTKNVLLSKGYSETAANEILKAAKSSKKFQNALGKAVSTTTKTTTTTTTKTLGGGLKAATKGLWEKTFGRLFKSGKTAPKVKPNQQAIVSAGSKWLKRATAARKVVFVGSLLALGYLGWTIYQAIQDVLGIDPLPDLDDVDVPDNVKDWKRCIVDALEGEDVTVSVENEDEFYVQLMVSEFAGKQTGGWIKFYNNYKVSTKLGDTGKWDCNTDVMAGINEQEDTQLEMDRDVEQMIDLLDFPVSGSDLQSAHALLSKYLKNGKGQSFLSLYQRSGLGGGDLRKTLKYIVTTKATSTRLKDEMLSMISKIEGGSKKDTEGTKSDKDDQNKSGGRTSHINVIWDDKSSGGSEGGKVKYSPCDSFPMSLGCISDKIKDIQRCLNPTANLKVDGYFGPNTLKAMQDKSLFADNDSDDVKITEEIYKKVTEELCSDKGSTDRTSSKETIKPQDTGAREKVEPIKIEMKPIAVLDPKAMLDKYSKEQLDRLKIKTIDGSRILDLLQNKVRFTPGGRYVLKDDNDITEDQLKVINQWMTSIGYSHDPVKVKRDRDGSVKYVWVARDRESRRVARLENRINKIKTQDNE
jgi:hypothetical protein